MAMSEPKLEVPTIYEAYIRPTTYGLYGTDWYSTPIPIDPIFVGWPMLLFRRLLVDFADDPRYLLLSKERCAVRSSSFSNLSHPESSESTGRSSSVFFSRDGLTVDVDSLFFRIWICVHHALAAKTRGMIWVWISAIWIQMNPNGVSGLWFPFADRSNQLNCTVTWPCTLFFGNPPSGSSYLFW